MQTRALPFAVVADIEVGFARVAQSVRRHVAAERANRRIILNMFGKAKLSGTRSTGGC